MSIQFCLFPLPMSVAVYGLYAVEIPKVLYAKILQGMALGPSAKFMVAGQNSEYMSVGLCG